MKRGSNSRIKRHSKREKKANDLPEDKMITYYIPPDHEDNPCGYISHQMEAVFTENMIKSILNPDEQVDLQLFQLVIRAVYYCNKDLFESTLRPLDLLNIDALVRCVSQLNSNGNCTEKLMVSNNFSVQGGDGFLFILPNKDMHHFVAGNITLDKHSNAYKFHTEIFDSAYSPTPVLDLPSKDKPKRAMQKTLKLEPYDFTGESAFYSSLVDSYIHPTLTQALGKDITIVEKQYSLHPSVLYQISPYDNTCGISSVLTVLLLLLKKKPGNATNGLPLLFSDYREYHVSMMCLFLVSIGKYFSCINVEYGDFGADKSTGKVEDEPQFSYFYNYIKNEIKKRKFDYNRALGNNIFSLFKFALD